MKKYYLTFIIALTYFISYGQTGVQVSFLEHIDSISGVTCGIPYNANFNLWGSTTNYSTTDSLDININFGNGNDTVFKIPATSWFNKMIMYTYTTTGSYTCQIIVTAPDLKADTATTLIYVDHCETITGNVYIDDNSNCTKDIGESGINKLLQLNQGGIPIYWTYSDAYGNYSFSVPAGLTGYSVSLSSTIGFNPICPSNNSISITSTP